MEETKKEKILVISSETDLFAMVKEAVGNSLEVIHIDNRQQGLKTARKVLPDMIALGYVEPQGAAFGLHRQLKEGWITKNIPLLIVDANPKDPAKRVLSMEEGLQIEADEFISLAGKDERAAVSQLAEPIVRLREILHIRLREQANTVKETILKPHTFCITWEQIPGRGAFEIQQEELILNARRKARRGKIHAVSVTDNPGGNPAISTEILCTEIKKK